MKANLAASWEETVSYQLQTLGKESPGFTKAAAYSHWIWIRFDLEVELSCLNKSDHHFSFSFFKQRKLLFKQRSKTWPYFLFLFLLFLFTWGVTGWATEDEPKSNPSTFDESNAKPKSDPFSVSIGSPEPDSKEWCLLMS